MDLTTLQDELDIWIDPQEFLPTEFLLDDYHPANDKYAKSIRELEQKIYAFGRAMKPKHRECARLARSQASTRDIAKKLGVTTKTVYTWLQRPEIKRLIILMDHLQQAHDGPQVNHRKHILYRIAIDNEEKRPNVAVQALQEINKMAGTYADAGNIGNNGNTVNVIINGEQLPRGQLDTLPDTYENRILEGKISDE